MSAAYPFLTGKVRVEVSRHWIDRATLALASRLPRECNCPVSHAVADAGFDNPRVAFGTFSAGPAIGDHPNRRRYTLPPEVATFIERYDDDYPVEPFTFTVDADDYREVIDGNDLARFLRCHA